MRLIAADQTTRYTGSFDYYAALRATRVTSLTGRPCAERTHHHCAGRNGPPPLKRADIPVDES